MRKREFFIFMRTFIIRFDERVDQYETICDRYDTGALRSLREWFHLSVHLVRFPLAKYRFTYQSLSVVGEKKVDRKRINAKLRAIDGYYIPAPLAMNAVHNGRNCYLCV